VKDGLGMWFNDGLDSVRLTVGLDDLKGLFRPKWFCALCLGLVVAVLGYVHEQTLRDCSEKIIWK